MASRPQPLERIDPVGPLRALTASDFEKEYYVSVKSQISKARSLMTVLRDTAVSCGAVQSVKELDNMSYESLQSIFPTVFNSFVSQVFQCTLPKEIEILGNLTYYTLYERITKKRKTASS